ncbi:MAG: hypothetical protein BGN88_01105 [Clostridiales bacterium 43-6]|nr:MAG: hypothetical protein BGN88_01105 [Clostridiales bacterium 43-6]
MLLGIDVGTTGVKAAVFDENGNMKGYGFREYDVIYSAPGYAEQDAEAVFAHTKTAIREAVREIGHKIAAISVSTQGDAVIPVDKNRSALSFAQLGMDYRGGKETEECKALFDERELFQKTGMRPHPMNSLIKIMWMSKHDPGLAERTHRFVTYADFILAKLGSDDFVIDYTMASRTMAFDIHTKAWSQEILQKLSLSARLFSTPVESGTVVGTIGKALSTELGIHEKTLLVAGGHDQPCAALGAGIVKENMALDSHGTAQVLSACFETPQTGETMFQSYYPCYFHVVKDMYFTFSLNHCGGILLQWYRDNLGLPEVTQAEKTGERAFEQIVKLAPKGPSPLLVLPHFNGSGTPTCDVNSKGAILGLTLSSTRHDIAKAIMESLVFELRGNMETMAKTGIDIADLRCVGGGARSPIDLQLKADITGLPVATLKTREAACLGAAIIAGYGAGVYGTIKEGANLTKTDTIYEPNMQLHSQYDEKYYLFTKLYSTLKEINPML